MDSVKCIHIVGVLFTLILGSLLHFVYAWSGENALAGIFGAVNESVWEHLKLLFWPMVLFGVVEYFLYGKDNPAFLPLRVSSILLGMLIIVAGFYTYSGILGYNYFPIDMLLFIFAVVFAYAFSYRKRNDSRYATTCANIAALIVLLLLIAAFAIFTFAPPEIGLFADPLA